MDVSVLRKSRFNERRDYSPTINFSDFFGVSRTDRFLQIPIISFWNWIFGLKILMPFGARNTSSWPQTWAETRYEPDDGEPSRLADSDPDPTRSAILITVLLGDGVALSFALALTNT
jgi:hypothetical protein